MERKEGNTKETRRKKCPNSIVPNFIAHFQKIFFSTSWGSVGLGTHYSAAMGRCLSRKALSPVWVLPPVWSVALRESPKAQRKSLAEPGIWISNSCALTTSLSFLSLTTQSISLLSCFLVRYNIMGLFLYSSTMVTWHYEIGTCHPQAMLFLLLPPKHTLSRLLSADDTRISCTLKPFFPAALT